MPHTYMDESKMGRGKVKCIRFHSHMNVPQCSEGKREKYAPNRDRDGAREEREREREHER